MKHKQDFLKGEIRRLRLNFKWQDSYMSHLEGIFARGDRKLSSVLVKACQMGCRFDGWSEHLNYNCWDEVLEGVDRDFYSTRKRSKDEVFPWDHIDCGVERDFLWSEYQRGLSAQFTPDCRMEGCQKCGVCNKEKQSISSLRTDEVISDHRGEKKEVATDKGRYVKLPEKGNSVHRVRLQFAKLGRARFLSHLELVTLFSRAIRRAEIPIRFSEGFHPLPKVVFSPALPVGIESIAEYVDLDIDGNTDILELTRKMSHQLPNWFKVLELREIPLKFPSISDSINKIEYSLSLEDLGEIFLSNSKELHDRIHAFLEMEEKYMEVKRKSGVVRIDLKSWVEKLKLTSDISLEMALRMREGKTVRPHDVLKAVLGLKEDEERKVSVLKTRVNFKTG